MKHLYSRETASETLLDYTQNIHMNGMYPHFLCHTEWKQPFCLYTNYFARVLVRPVTLVAFLRHETLVVFYDLVYHNR